METAVVGVDELGPIAIAIAAEFALPDKKNRKRAFNDMLKLVQLGRLIPEGSKVHQIGRGVDRDGRPVFIFHYMLPRVKPARGDPIDSKKIYLRSV